MKRRTFQTIIFLLVVLPLAGAPVWAGEPVPAPTPEPGGTFTVDLTPQMLSIIPALVLLLQVLKGIEPLAKIKAWFPLIGIGIAVGLGILLRMGPDLQGQILAGVTMGLATTGTYEVAKSSNRIAAGPTP